MGYDRLEATLFAANQERPVTKHKYAVGQTVRFSNNGYLSVAAREDFKVTRLLPTEGSECEYRIKCAGEPFERVARESQLDRLPRPSK
jgi:hypothetical protein